MGQSRRTTRTAGSTRWAPDARPVVVDHLRDTAWVGGPGHHTRPAGSRTDRVYFISERTGYAHLYTVPAAGGPATRVTSGRLGGDRAGALAGPAHLLPDDQRDAPRRAAAVRRARGGRRAPTRHPPGGVDGGHGLPGRALAGAAALHGRRAAGAVPDAQRAPAPGRAR